MAPITKKQYEAAIAIINAFNAGKETKMSKKANARKSAPKNTKATERIAEINKNLSRVTATTEGKTGWGVEFAIADMAKKDDLTPELWADIRKEQGYNFMMAKWEDVDGAWTCTRECYFWQSFPTKKARDAEVKRLSADLAPTKASTKKAEPKKSAPTKASTKKSAPKKETAPSAKDALIAALSEMSTEEKKAFFAALIGA